MIVHALSAALRSASLDDERRDRLHAIERVLAVSRSLVADLDRPRIVASIVDAVAELLGADVVALVSRQPDGAFRLEAGKGFPEEAIGSTALPNDGFVARAIASRQRIIGLQEVAAWPPEYLAGRPGGTTPHAAMALPIEVGSEIAAVLLITRIGADQTYSDLERGVADLLTAQVAIALQNADLHARVAKSALRDPLTGLLNRRFFDEAVETAHANARRAGTELSLIVLDLDRFSAVNNEYGHAVGDAVLRRVARAIRSATREGDVLVRYGGEEFVVIAPATDGDGAVAAAERIRAAVAAAGTELVDGRIVPLTVSAGVASLVDETDGRGLFRAARFGAPCREARRPRPSHQESETSRGDSRRPAARQRRRLCSKGGGPHSPIPLSETAPLLEARSLSKSFRGLHALVDYDLRLPPLTIHGVIGPNGAGKTTLFHLLSGFMQPTSGSISFEGRDITGTRAFRRRAAGHRPHLPEHQAVRRAVRARQRQGRAPAPVEAVDPSACSCRARPSGGPRGSSTIAPWSCSSCSDSPTSATARPATCRTATSVGSRSRGRSASSPRSCCWTSRTRA